MLRKHSQTFLLLHKIVDLSIILSTFIASYFIKFNTLDIPFHYLLLLITIITGWFAMASIFKCYDTSRTKRLIQELNLVVKAYVILTVLLSFPLYYLHNYFSRIQYLVFTSSSFCCFLGLKIVVRYLLRYIRKKGYNMRLLLIVGGGPLAKLLLDKVYSHPEFGYKDPIVVADSVSEEALKPLLKGTTDDLVSIIRRYSVDDVIVAFPLSMDKKILAIINRCEAEGIRVRIALDFVQIVSSRLIMEDIDDVPLIGLRSEPLLSLWNRMVKRTFDIVASAAALIVLSPILLLVAIGIKCDSPGPILFRQKRIGRNGKEFIIFKFRSMVAGAEKFDAEAGLGIRNDPRCTRLGKFLRRQSLDELPQFWNVLRGDMSLVGPRPERELFADQFANEIHGYRIRQLVPVGITGWAQVNGLRGDTSLSERIKYDHYYIENWSIWFDIKILLMTVFKKSRNAI